MISLIYMTCLVGLLQMPKAPQKAEISGSQLRAVQESWKYVRSIRNLNRRQRQLESYLVEVTHDSNVYEVTF